MLRRFTLALALVDGVLQLAGRAQPTAVRVLRPARVYDGVAMHDGWILVVRGRSIEACRPAGVSCSMSARVWRTLVSLFFRPERVTELYLLGKRMSFVRPLRIYLVVSALLFLIVNATSELDGMQVSESGDIKVLDGNPGKSDSDPDNAEPEDAAKEVPPAAAPASSGQAAGLEPATPGADAGTFTVDIGADVTGTLFPGLYQLDLAASSDQVGLITERQVDLEVTP